MTMQIPKATTGWIVVSKDWSELGGVRFLLGPADGPLNPNEASHMLVASVLDDSDSHGLWIELNTGHEKWPGKPTFRMLIPWHYIISIVWSEESVPKKTIGFLSPSATSASGVTTLDKQIAQGD